MSENKHTPGPWEEVPQSSGGPIIARRFATGKQMNPTGLRLITHVFERRDSISEDRANARLIAAAPDLLRVCLQMEALSHKTLSVEQWSGEFEAIMRDMRFQLDKTTQG